MGGTSIENRKHEMFPPLAISGNKAHEKRDQLGVMGSGGLSNLFSIWTFGMVAEVEMSPMSRSTMRQRSRSVPTVDCRVLGDVIAGLPCRLAHLNLRGNSYAEIQRSAAGDPSTRQTGGGEVLFYRGEATSLERLVISDDDSARMAALSFLAAPGISIYLRLNLLGTIKVSVG